MAESPKWQETKFEISLPDELQSLFDVFTGLVGGLGDVLKITKDGLNLVKTFLANDLNPLLLLLKFIVDQLISVVQNIKESGVYIIAIWPEPSIGKFIKYKDIFPGFNTPEGQPDQGFHTLPTQDCLNVFLQSFDDAGDVNRPPTADNISLGGAVIFFGTGSPFTEETIKVMKAFVSFIDQFLNLKEFKDFTKELGEKLTKITNAKASTTTPTPVLTKSIAPDWNSKKLFRDFFPELGDILTDVEGNLNAFNEQLVGGQDAIASTVAYIDKKISQLDTIITKIDTYAQKLKDIQSGLTALESAVISTLVVEPQVGGLSVLKNAVNSAEGKPDSGFQYCALVSFIGTGTGFSMLLYMLGLTDSITFGDNGDIEFTEDSLKAKYEELSS